VVDIIRGYHPRLTHHPEGVRDYKEGSQLVTKSNQLKLEAADGKKSLSDAAAGETENPQDRLRQKVMGSANHRGFHDNEPELDGQTIQHRGSRFLGEPVAQCGKGAIICGDARPVEYEKTGDSCTRQAFARRLPAFCSGGDGARGHGMFAYPRKLLKTALRQAAPFRDFGFDACQIQATVNPIHQPLKELCKHTPRNLSQAYY
jgi:hypothetical protein